jgi:transposase
MGRKGKVSVEEKLTAIKSYLLGEKSVAQICSDFCICKQSFRTWIRKYNMNGENGLVVTHKNKIYSEEIKYMAIHDYLDGNGSLENICTKYEIPSICSLQKWFKKYNSHKVFKSHNKQGERIMTNGRKTTYEERTEIVTFCISNNDDCQVTADKFKVSYQQVCLCLGKKIRS